MLSNSIQPNVHSHTFVQEKKSHVDFYFYDDVGNERQASHCVTVTAEVKASLEATYAMAGSST